VGYIDPIHGPLDGPLYMGSHIHQHISEQSKTMGIDIEMCVLPTESKIHEKLKAINQIEQYKIIHW